ncbi:hypothetical protein BDV06DRAFT_202555 [Aspergillus oleicola]
MARIPGPLIVPITFAEFRYASGVFTSPSWQEFRVRISNRPSNSMDDDPLPEPEGFTEGDLRAGGKRLCSPPCETLRQLGDGSYFP